jgi:Flp pilus assembly pilin Flp
MSRLLRFAQRLLKNETGATAVEYAVLLASLVLVCAVALEVLGNQMVDSFTDMANLIGTGS